MCPKIPVAAVVGPTASGKSRLAVELALQRNGEVVSADSMQIYKGLVIGAAQPSAEEMRGVPHHLIGFAEPCQLFSVAEYVELASACIRDIAARGKLPILVGGTGLYVRSLLHNIQFSPQAGDPALRKELFARAERDGGQALLEELRQFDPRSAESMHPNNLKRIVRAIEVYRVTGVTMTEQIALSHQEESPYHTCLIGLNFADRQELYSRINARVDFMLQAGLVEEARRVLSMKLSTARQAIGYKEFIPFFRDECTMEQAVEELKRNTRHYAKRQLTWFRREEGICWLEMSGGVGFDYAAQNALELLDSTLTGRREAGSEPLC